MMFIENIVIITANNTNLIVISISFNNITQELRPLPVGEIVIFFVGNPNTNLSKLIHDFRTIIEKLQEYYRKSLDFER